MQTSIINILGKESGHIMITLWIESKKYMYVCLFRYIGRSRMGGVGVISRSPIPLGICEGKCYSYKSSTTPPIGKINPGSAPEMHVVWILYDILKQHVTYLFSIITQLFQTVALNLLSQNALTGRSVWGGHVINFIKWLIVITSIRPGGIDWRYTHSFCLAKTVKNMGLCVRLCVYTVCM